MRCGYGYCNNKEIDIANEMLPNVELYVCRKCNNFVKWRIEYEY